MTERTRIRICLAVIAVLSLIVAAMAYKFIFAGSVRRGNDSRLVIVLEPGERALVLKEMRRFVSGLQMITAALSRGDMKAVADAARGLGMHRERNVPLTLMGKLPLQFKLVALSVHGKFDAIAKDADAGATPTRILSQLASALGQCAACHASYRFANRAAP